MTKFIQNYYIFIEKTKFNIFLYYSSILGIMIVVVPNLLGLALWSPPLDRMGNSTRGVAFCKVIVLRLNF